MRFLYSAVNWRRWALTTTSGSGRVLVSPGAALRSASLRSASLRSAPGETKTQGVGAIPFNFIFMSISFSAPYTKYRAGRRLTDLGAEGAPEITQPLDDAIWVDQLKPPKRFNLINKDGAALPEFKEINRAAYWDYQRQRVYVRSSKTIRKAIEKVGRRKAKYLPAKQPVQHPVPLSCSYCGCADLRRGGTTFVLAHDVRFLHSGVKGYVT